MKNNTLVQVGSMTNGRRTFLAKSCLAVVAPSALAACGGAGDDLKVTLYATISSGKVGASFSLSAEVESDNGISEVNFYRVTSNSKILLATFTGKPYLLQTTIPDGTAGTTIEYMARAEDDEDQTTDSAKVSITVSS
jgi:Bacterial Ig domain